MPSNKERPAEGPEGGSSKKKVKFSSQVSVQEFHAHPAAETVVFHLLHGTTPAELEQEISTGGQPFHCDFYNQVSGTHPRLTCVQQVRMARTHAVALVCMLNSVTVICTCCGHVRNVCMYLSSMFVSLAGVW
jgi:hypothetical protein